MVNINIRKTTGAWTVYIYAENNVPLHSIECDDINVLESIIKPYLKGEI